MNIYKAEFIPIGMRFLHKTGQGHYVFGIVTSNTNFLIQLTSEDGSTYYLGSNLDGLIKSMITLLDYKTTGN